MNVREIAGLLVMLMLLIAVAFEDPIAEAATDQDRVKALTARIDALEKTLDASQRSRELLLVKLTKLERSLRDHRHDNSRVSSPSSGMSQVQRETGSLKRAISNLETRATNAESNQTQMSREVARLRSSVATLRNEVDRLKSRR